MLLLKKGNTADHIVVTLTEKSVLTGPHYLFVCEHITNKTFIRFVLGADQSAFTRRFNEFIINTSVVFAGAPLGQWLYKIYEQASAVNTDETGLNLVESGKLDYLDNVTFTYPVYEPQTSYKTYEG